MPSPSCKLARETRHFRARVSYCLATTYASDDAIEPQALFRYETESLDISLAIFVVACPKAGSLSSTFPNRTKFPQAMNFSGDRQKFSLIPRRRRYCARSYRSMSNFLR